MSFVPPNLIIHGTAGSPNKGHKDTQNIWGSMARKIESGARDVQTAADQAYMAQQQAKGSVKPMDTKWLWIAGGAVVAWYFLSQ